MATLTIRGLNEDVRDRLRVRAATHGRSMEAEASPVERSLVDIMLAMRTALDGEGLEFPSRADEVGDPFT